MLHLVPHQIHQHFQSERCPEGFTLWGLISLSLLFVLHLLFGSHDLYIYHSLVLNELINIPINTLIFLTRTSGGRTWNET